MFLFCGFFVQRERRVLELRRCCSGAHFLFTRRRTRGRTVSSRVRMFNGAIVASLSSERAGKRRVGPTVGRAPATVSASQVSQRPILLDATLESRKRGGLGPCEHRSTDRFVAKSPSLLAASAFFKISFTPFSSFYSIKGNA